MSRHGECTEAAPALQHKFRDLRSVTGPEQFSDEMKSRGLAARVTADYGGNREAVLVEVPEREVSVIFVRPNLCRERLRR